LDTLQLESLAQELIGGYTWMFVAAFFLVLFRSTVEGLTQSFKVFFGKGLNTDDIIFIWIEGKKYAARIIRLGMFKSTFTVYDVSRTSDGKAYISGGEKLEIQNDKIKDFVITKPLTKVDLESWENGFSDGDH